MTDNPAFLFLVGVIVLVVLGLLFKVGEGGEGSWGDKSFKAGSIVGLGVFAVVALAFIFNRTDDEGKSDDHAQDCSVQGLVTNRDNNAPLANAEIGIAPFGSVFTQDERFEFKTNIAPDGSYRFSCVGAPEGSAIAIRDLGWGGCIDVTDFRVPTSGNTFDANLATSDRAMEMLGQLRGVPRNDNCE